MPFGKQLLHYIVGWLPIVFLLAGFVNHLWLVKNHHLSPWLGAGFGMFSTTDVGSARQIFLSLRLSDDSDYRIDLEDPYRDVLERTRGLPTSMWMERLADETFHALREAPDLNLPAQPLTLNIELWRNSYTPGNLLPVSDILVRAKFPLPDDQR